MNIQLIRHATLLLSIKGQKILVDPMLGSKESAPPIQQSGNDLRNPLVALPDNLPDWNKLDALIITHCHRDHLDEMAITLLPKNLPVFCQPTDTATLQEAGFTQVLPIQDTYSWKGITLTRTTGQHGTGEIGERMGLVSGFVIKTDEYPTLYIAGDTIWCEEVRQALLTHQPEFAIVNAGAAQFLSGDPITMNAADIMEVCQHAPNTTVIAVHMEAINHCLLTREQLKQELIKHEYDAKVLIPADGESLSLA